MKSGNRLILFVTFVLVLLAGIVLGRLWGRLPERRAPSGAPPSWLADQLDLSQDQRQKMDAIWADTRKELGETMKGRRDLDKQREEAIVALLTPAQKTDYDRINQDFRRKREDLDQKRQAMIHEAETRSRALLNAEQAKAWDSVNQRWRERHQRGGRHGPPKGTTLPASRPAIQQDM
jgi:hypothetical protein